MLGYWGGWWVVTPPITGWENEREYASRFGFKWGPMVVSRAARIEGRGFCVEVATEHARMQILVSERGRRITSYPIRNAGERGGGGS